MIGHVLEDRGTVTVIVARFDGTGLKANRAIYPFVDR
jgi:hypothetical protein